jgi:hypothetical protein
MEKQFTFKLVFPVFPGDIQHGCRTQYIRTNKSEGINDRTVNMTFRRQVNYPIESVFIKDLINGLFVRYISLSKI